MKNARTLTLSLALTSLACGQDGPKQLSIHSKPAKQSQAIEGGSLDTSSDAVVAIMFVDDTDHIGICTGSLIAPNLVMSAHHCVANVGANVTSCGQVAFGPIHALSKFMVTTSYDAAATFFANATLPNADGQTWFAVQNVWVPGDDICGQDMSLLELSTPISGVCPLLPRVDSPVAVNEPYSAKGFGITTPGGSNAGTRYSLSGLSVFCDSNCGATRSPNGEWEGGSHQEEGTCEGDSGGPALDANNRVIGSVSRGPQGTCSDTVYESVFALASWLKQNAAQAAQDGQYTAAAWVTGASTSNPANGYCGGGNSGAGGGSGQTAGSCSDPALSCMDASGMGDFACVDPMVGIPSSATACMGNSDCPTGYSCWKSGSTTGCLQDCGVSSGAGGGNGATGGGSSAGGGTGGGLGSGGGGGSEGSQNPPPPGPSPFGGGGGMNGVAPMRSCAAGPGAPLLWLALVALRRYRK